MKTVVISQPMLFPWPGFFEQLMLADAYVYLDDAQFSKGSFTNRVQIVSGGRVSWLTVPLAGSGSFTPISRLQGADRDWRAENLAVLQAAYAGASYGKDALKIAEAAYAQETVCDVFIASIEETAHYLGIGREMARRRSSAMTIAGRSSLRVLEIVMASGGTRYLTGHGAANYLDHETFEAAGIKVDYMNYSKTAWPQSSSVFTPFVSALDLIANCGPQAARYLAPATVPWRDFLASRT